MAATPTLGDTPPQDVWTTAVEVGSAQRSEGKTLARPDDTHTEHIVPKACRGKYMNARALSRQLRFILGVLMIYHEQLLAP